MSLDRRWFAVFVTASALAAAACADDETDASIEDVDLDDAGGGGRTPSLPGDEDSGTPIDPEPDADAGSTSRGSLGLLAGSSATGSADGVGIAARFNGPSGGVLLPDRSALIIADTFNAVLRRVDLATGAVTTVAGKVQVQATADGAGTGARFQSPRAMVAAPDGSAVYVADGPTLRKVTIPGYVVTTIAGTAGASGYEDGTGATVRLGFLLHALELSADGQTLYVADRSNRVLRTLTLATGAVATVAGTHYTGAELHVDGVGAAARFSGMGGITRDGDVLYVADTFNHVIRRVSLNDFAVTTLSGAAGDAAITDGDSGVARFDTPQGLVSGGGYLWSTSFDGVLRRVSPTDGSVTTVLGDPNDARPVDGVGADARLGLAFAQPIPDPTANTLWYQDRSASSIRKIALETLAVETFAGAKEPEATKNGSLAESRFVAPSGLTASADGKTWLVTDDGASVVRKIDVAAGVVSTLAGVPGERTTTNGSLAEARFSSPGAIVWDHARARAYVAEPSARVVRAIDLTAGTVDTLAGQADVAGTADGAATAATFAAPTGLALDVANSKLFISDVSSTSVPGGWAAIRVLDLTTSVVSTVVGGARATPPVDGPFASASFNSPAAIAVDAAQQKLFVAESSRATIRVVNLGAATVATLAGLDGERGPADGTLTAARFASPGGLAFSAGSNALFVTDSGNNTMRRVDLGAGTVSTWLGDPSRSGGIAPGTTSTFEESTLYFPSAPVIAGGDIGFVSEHGVYLARPTVAVAP